jgi:hypothetical protein
MDVRNKRDQAILKYILADLGLNVKQFSESLGNTRHDAIYKVENAKGGISVNFANKIKEFYPKYNLDWLLTGQGSPDGNKDVQFIVLDESLVEDSERMDVLVPFLSENHEKLMEKPIYKMFIDSLKEGWKNDLEEEELNKKATGKK